MDNILTEGGGRHARSQILHSQAGGQRLLELVRLLQVLDAKSVQVLAAADLELDDVLRLLDLDGCGHKVGGRRKISRLTLALLRLHMARAVGGQRKPRPE